MNFEWCLQSRIDGEKDSPKNFFNFSAKIIKMLNLFIFLGQDLKNSETFLLLLIIMHLVNHLICDIDINLFFNKSQNIEVFY